MHDSNILEDQPIAWTPTPEVIERAQLTKFMKQVGVSTWDELYEFSISDVEKFTEEVLKFLDIKFDPPYEKLLDVSDGVEFPKWFSTQRREDAKSEPDAIAGQKLVPPALAGQKSEPPASADQKLVPPALAGEKSEPPASADQKSVPPASADQKSEPPALAGGQEDGMNSTSRPPAHAGGTDLNHAGLNITTMCLDRWNNTAEDRGRDAIVWEPEDPDEEGEYISYGELLRDVESWAAGLRKLGLGKGDAIGLHLPMIPETVLSLLAINRIGAIAVPVFSGYGVEAVASRLNAVEAVGLIAATGFPRRGKMVDSLAVSVAAAKATPSLKHLIVVENYGRLENYEFDLSNVSVTPFLDVEVLEGETPESDRGSEPTSAEDPLIILYTSGTTGKPKGIAHTHASFPIKSAQDMAFGMDVGRGTRICWYTDIGWMMGPWLIYGALINGGTICIYDGAPDYPTPDRMWEFCAKHKVEILGIAPTLVRSLAAQESSPPYEGGVSERREDGVVLSSGENKTENHPTVEAAPLLRKEGSLKPPHERHDLSSLRAFASSGEPWNPAPWWWLFEMVGNSKLPIINYSGGTEISGGILCGNPLLPQKPCSFPAPCPGMDVGILDENGDPVGPNEVGELVIKQPWIGMARGFWQEKERYLDTYWRRFKNIWVHGDWAMRDADGHWFILGRSDDTLKVAGKRVGPAEVEGLLVSHPNVAEAAVIGVPHEIKGTAMIAFCVLSSPPYEGGVDAAAADGVVLAAELKQLVAKDMGKPLAPSKIHFVSALPKTRNAKVMRRVIRSAYLGEDPGDISSLENPAAVDEISRTGRNDD